MYIYNLNRFHLRQKKINENPPEWQQLNNYFGIDDVM